MNCAAAIHDTLTACSTGAILDESVPRELHLAQRRNAPLCVVMRDIDGFKHSRFSWARTW